MITPNFHFKNLGTILINKTFAGPIRTLQTKTLYSQTQWSHFHAPKNKTWWIRLPVVSRKKNANSTCERFGSCFGLIHGRGKYGCSRHHWQSQISIDRSEPCWSHDFSSCIGLYG